MGLGKKIEWRLGRENGCDAFAEWSPRGTFTPLVRVLYSGSLCLRGKHPYVGSPTRFFHIVTKKQINCFSKAGIYEVCFVFLIFMYLCLYFPFLLVVVFFKLITA